MLIFREPIRGSTSYTRLQIVPRGLYDIIFIAFHSNPIGGHLNAYRTLHRLRLRYHWPEMYSFIKRMCNRLRTGQSDSQHFLGARLPLPDRCSLSSPLCRRLLRREALRIRRL